MPLASFTSFCPFGDLILANMPGLYLCTYLQQSDFIFLSISSTVPSCITGQQKVTD